MVKDQIVVDYSTLLLFEDKVHCEGGPSEGYLLTFTTEVT